MKTLFAVLTFFLAVAPASADVMSRGDLADVDGREKPKIRRMDLDGDGYKDADVSFLNGKVVLATMDKNGDGRPDVVIHYRGGFRDYAEIDSDFDGLADAWVNYYFTGMPSSIRIDSNRDGAPDRFKYFKNGFVYKREWDRNHDGRVDLRFIFEGNPDLRKLHQDSVEKAIDTNFDGTFDRAVHLNRRVPTYRIELAPGSLQEIRIN